MKEASDLFRVSSSTSDAYKRDLVFSLSGNTPNLDPILLNAYRNENNNSNIGIVDHPAFQHLYREKIELENKPLNETFGSTGTFKLPLNPISQDAIDENNNKQVLGRPGGSSMYCADIQRCIAVGCASPEKKVQAKRHFDLRLAARNNHCRKAVSLGEKEGNVDFHSDDEYVYLSESDEDENNTNNSAHSIGTHSLTTQQKNKAPNLLVRSASNHVRNGSTSSSQLEKGGSSGSLMLNHNDPSLDSKLSSIQILTPSFASIKNGKSPKNFMVAVRTNDLLARVNSCRRLQTFSGLIHSNDLISGGADPNGSPPFFDGETPYRLNQSIHSNTLPGGHLRNQPDLMSIKSNDLINSKPAFNDKQLPTSFFSFPQNPNDKQFRLRNDHSFTLNRFVHDSPTKYPIQPLSSPSLPPVSPGSRQNLLASPKASPDKSDVRAEMIALSKSTRGERTRHLPPYHANSPLNPFDPPLEYRDVMHGKYAPPLMAFIRAAAQTGSVPSPPRWLSTLNHISTDLDLSHRDLDLLDALPLAASLRARRGSFELKRLSLEGNPRLGDDGVGIILESLQGHCSNPLHSLEELNIRECGVVEDSIWMLSGMLASSKFPSLRRLYIGKNEIKVGSVWKIFTIMRNIGIQLHVLDVSDCSFGKLADTTTAGLPIQSKKNEEEGLPAELINASFGSWLILASSITKFSELQGLKIGGWRSRLVREACDALNSSWSNVTGLKWVDFSSTCPPRDGLQPVHESLKIQLAIQRKEAAKAKGGGGKDEIAIPDEALGALPSPANPLHVLVHSLILNASDLEELNLSNCNMDAAGILLLARTIAESNRPLRGVKLRNSMFGKIGFRACVRMLCAGLIESLDLAGSSSPHIYDLDSSSRLESIALLTRLVAGDETVKEAVSEPFTVSLDLSNITERNVLIEYCLFLHASLTPGFAPSFGALLDLPVIQSSPIIPVDLSEGGYNDGNGVNENVGDSQIEPQQQLHSNFPMSNAMIQAGCSSAFFTSGKTFKVPVISAISSIPSKDILTFTVKLPGMRIPNPALSAISPVPEGKSAKTEKPAKDKSSAQTLQTEKVSLTVGDGIVKINQRVKMVPGSSLKWPSLKLFQKRFLGALLRSEKSKESAVQLLEALVDEIELSAETVSYFRNILSDTKLKSEFKRIVDKII